VNAVSCFNIKRGQTAAGFFLRVQGATLGRAWGDRPALGVLVRDPGDPREPGSRKRIARDPFSLISVFVRSVPLSPCCFHRREGLSAYLNLMFTFFNGGKVENIV